MSKGFLNKLQLNANVFQSNSDELQKKIDPVAQAKWLENTGKDAGFSIYNNPKNKPSQLKNSEEINETKGGFTNRAWVWVEKLLNKTEFSTDDIDHYIFTQINKSVIIKVMNELGQPLEKTTMVMDKYAYTGSGCVPMAFYHAVSQKRIKRGDKVLFMASGAGLAVGSNLFVY